MRPLTSVDLFRYRNRFLDDDDEEDLSNMESSFDQIEREEDFRYAPKETLSLYLLHLFSSSRRQGLREDIEDVLREEAEKKRRASQAKKRPKTGA